MPFKKGYTPWNKKDKLPVEFKDCGCGCSEQTEKYDARGRERTFIYGHGNRGKKFPSLKHAKQFQKGQTPWNKGKHVENTGTFKKGHKINLGRKFPPEFGEKISKAQRGKSPTYFGASHWNWKGGITKKDKYLRQKFRKTIGRDVLKRDNYTCQVCSSTKNYLHVDHIKEWSKYPEDRFNPENCITLCYKCHYKKTFGKEIPPNMKWGQF